MFRFSSSPTRPIGTDGRGGIIRGGAGFSGGGLVITAISHIIGQGYSDTTVIAICCALATVTLISAAVRVYTIRARRTPAQVRAAAMASAARRMTDPECALRMLAAAGQQVKDTSDRPAITPAGHPSTPRVRRPGGRGGR